MWLATHDEEFSPTAFELRGLPRYFLFMRGDDCATTLEGLLATLLDI